MTQRKSKKESMTIFTERLIIRHPKISDAVALNSAIIESIRELKKYLAWANKIPSTSDTQNNIENAIRLIETNADVRFLIFSKDNDFIGSSGLHKIDWQIKKAEIGYWIRTTKSGNGFMTEAVNAIANYGINELGLQRIEIVCSGSNTKSRRIPEKLGFTLEGILKKHRINGDGTIDDTVYYAKVI
jgi:ribosomal-protein-serine acetyltransferase